MVDWVIGLWNLHPELVFSSIVLLLLFDKTGFVQNLIRRREYKKEAAKDRESSIQDLLSEETHRLIATMQSELDEVRDRHRNDIKYYLQELASCRAIIIERDNQLRAKDEVITNLSRGESRMRHAFMNVATAFDAIRSFCWNNNLRPPAFNGWRDLMGVDSELDKHLENVFEKEPPRISNNSGGK